MKTTTSALVLFLLLGPAYASAQQQPTAAPSREKILQAALEVMAGARYCTLITMDQSGQPQARVVDPFAPEADMTVWIATRPNTRKVAQLKNNPRATMLCYDPQKYGYVTLLGKAVVVDDAAEKARHWKPEWKDFYQDENRGPDYVLIRMKPTRLEILSPAHGIINNPLTWQPVTLEF